MTTLQKHLILHPFICREFGYTDMNVVLDRLRDATSTYTASGESEYSQTLYLKPERAKISPDVLVEYGTNINTHKNVDDHSSWASLMPPIHEGNCPTSEF